jgi:hypothetical protein
VNALKPLEYGLVSDERETIIGKTFQVMYFLFCKNLSIFFFFGGT